MSASVNCLSDPNQLRVYRCDTRGHLTPSSLAELWQPSTLENAPQIDVLYVHGNRMTVSDMLERGLQIHHRMRMKSPHGAPIRWIMWSWPSEKEGLLLTDVRTKAARADAQAHYLAWFMRRLDQSHELRMIGYSFGARVITGSLHVYAGGRVGCAAIETVEPIKGRNIRVGILAPALHAEWLGPNQPHGLAGQNMESMHLFINKIDPVLAGYWLLDPTDKSPAMGIRGVTHRPRDSTGKLIPLSTHNCSDFVGRHHDELRYYDSPCLANCVLSKLVWEPSSVVVRP